MIYRSKAPFRLGLAGGGTDVSPYSDKFGGAILNVTVNLFANTTIIPTDNGKIVFKSVDQGCTEIFDASEEIPTDGNLSLQKGVYNRIVKDFIKKPLSFELVTSMDVATGSGLGTSSTLVVSILGAFVEWLKLPLGEYDIAHLAYEIERVDLNMSGGRQDQYAATFGGVNFMEFSGNDKVIVNPLRIKEESLVELEHNLILYYTKTSRESSKIIDAQINNVEKNDQSSIDAMHLVKEQSYMMKEALLKNKLNDIGYILNESWSNKKKMALGITNSEIDEVYSKAMKAGAIGGKISGAGGGGFMLFYCDKNKRHDVIRELNSFGGEVRNYQIDQKGLYTWTVKD